MKLLNYIILTLLTINFAFAQNSVKRADQLYNQFDFQNALDLYQVAAKKNTTVHINEQIGNCYRFLNQIQNAETSYEAVVKSNESDPVYNFYYAQALMSNGKYHEALNELNNYYTKTNTLNKVVDEFPSNILKENYNYKIKIEAFNSNDDDFSPYKIEDEVFFISNRNTDAIILKEDIWSGKYFTQLFHINTIDSSNTKAQVFNTNSISKKFHEGPIAFNKSKNELYFTRSNYTNIKKPTKGSDDAVNLKILKIPFTIEDVKGENFNQKLSIEENITFSNDDYSIAYPTFSADGKYLIFASDMPNGYGGLDLYVSERVGEEWSNPINLGEEINTIGNEAYPFLNNKGELYFSSNGLLGLGSYDIFKTVLNSNGEYETPINLRSPMNSSYNDFGIWLNDENTIGYFSSDRPAEFNATNIYSFTHTSYSFDALVYDSRTKEPIEDVEIIFTEIKSGEDIIIHTNDLGRANHEISPNTDYKIQITKEGYFTEEAEFTTIENDVTAEIPLNSATEILLDIDVLEAKTLKEIPNADLILYNLNTEEKQTIQTNMFGKANLFLEPGNEYRIIAQKDLPHTDSVYISVSKDINTENLTGLNKLEEKILLNKECSGCEIIIEDILYDLDKSFIRADAALILNQLVKVLKDNPNMEIELASHTDCRASVSYNNNLSTKRAEAAVAYLIKNGINPTRLTAKGYGESKPLEVEAYPGLYCTCENENGPGSTDPRCSEEMHQKNRRTSFTILK